LNSLSLPDPFLSAIRNVFGEKGEAFLAGLPALIKSAAQRWGLTELQTIPDLSYNFVAFAKRGMEDVVLKLGVPNRELTGEIAALRTYAGQGAVRLLDSDAAQGMLLLERLRPGGMLARLEDDTCATEIAAGVMEQIRLPAPESGDFILLKDWFDGFKRLRARFEGGTGPLPDHLVEQAGHIAGDFFSEGRPDVLLHGDFHHYNILQSGYGWVVIDPKGVIGPAEYEVGPLLLNPYGRVPGGENPEGRTLKRIAILAERLGVERERIRLWAFAHAVLSAWWSIEDNGDWRYAIECAELFDRL
jgi:streptomycin 6-kinase